MENKLIIFDVGGTMLDNDDFNFENGLKYLYDEILDVKEDYNTFLNFVNSYKDIFSKRDDTLIEISFVSYLNYLYLCYNKKTILDIDEVEMNFIHHVYHPYLVKDLIKCLTYLKNKKYKLLVFSNSMFQTKAIRQELKDLGIDQYFDEIISSGDHLFRKPSSFIFSSYLKKYEILPNNVMYIGNDYDIDIITPIKLKMKCALRSDKLIDHGNYLEFDNYENLIRWFKENGY